VKQGEAKQGDTTVLSYEGYSVKNVIFQCEMFRYPGINGSSKKYFTCAISVQFLHIFSIIPVYVLKGIYLCGLPR